MGCQRIWKPVFWRPNDHFWRPGQPRATVHVPYDCLMDRDSSEPKTPRWDAIGDPRWSLPALFTPIILDNNDPTKGMARSHCRHSRCQARPRGVPVSMCFRTGGLTWGNT
eukprot:gene9621-biopygen3232